MRESELLSHIYERSRGLVSPGATIVVGPGDDCAVVRTGGAGERGDEILLKVDQLVEGRHYAAGTPVDLIARKAVARAISDIAAMGGTPTVALCGATLPSAYSGANELFDAVHRWANHFSCPLVGGDIASLAERQIGPLVLAVTVVGRPHGVRGAVLRSTARVGDAVWVTGALGNSLESGRHLRFEPRLREAAWLCDSLGADLHAMMDLSDGLGIDAARLGAASGVRLELAAASFPVHRDCPDWRRAASDGEDYELLFTVREGVDVPAACPGTGTAVTRIGRVAGGKAGLTGGAAIVDPSGHEVDAGRMGWEHGVG